MSLTHHFTLIYPKSQPPQSVRQVMHALYIPKKMQHQLRISQSILVNQAYRSMNELVLPGDQLDFYFPNSGNQHQQYLASSHLPEIIYEDANLLIINKPAGQKSHPNRPDENTTALNDATYYLKSQQQAPYMVHRLDMLTQGLLLIAKNPFVVPLLNRQLVDKTFARFYHAITSFRPEVPAIGTITFPLASDPTDKRKMQITDNGLSAQTHYQVVAHQNNLALIDLALATGRTHQLRVHLAAIGLPILFDPLYHPDYQENQLNNLQLQAYKLQVTKPFSFTKLTVALPLSKQLTLDIKKGL